MFDGRHCTKADLVLLEKETNRVLDEISHKNLAKLGYFVNFVARFDSEIADKMSRQIMFANGDIERIQTIINQNIDILKQCVVVDMYEHQRN